MLQLVITGHFLCLYNNSDGVQDCLETRVDVVRTSLRQLQEKLSQVSDLSHDFETSYFLFGYLSNGKKY